MIHRCVMIFAACISVFMLSSAGAEPGYPSRPIKLIVLQSAGSGQDVVMRVIADKFKEKFGYNIVIENLPKASGEPGKKACAAADPDGYTFCSVADGGSAIFPAFYEVAKEEIPANNLTPVRIVADQYFVFVTSKGRPQTFPDFLDSARKNPGKLSCGSGNISGRLGMAILNAIPGVNVAEIPYYGKETAMQTDLYAGVIDCAFSTMAAVLPHLESGTIKALGTFGSRRNPFLRDVLPLSTLECPACGELPSWYAIWAPPGLPQELVAVWNKNLDVVLEDPAVTDLLAKSGVSVRKKSTPAELTAETQSIFTAAKKLICKERIELNGRTCKQ